MSGVISKVVAKVGQLHIGQFELGMEFHSPEKIGVTDEVKVIRISEAPEATFHFNEVFHGLWDT